MSKRCHPTPGPDKLLSNIKNVIEPSINPFYTRLGQGKIVLSSALFTGKAWITGELNLGIFRENFPLSGPEALSNFDMIVRKKGTKSQSKSDLDAKTCLYVSNKTLGCGKIKLKVFHYSYKFTFFKVCKVTLAFPPPSGSTANYKVLCLDEQFLKNEHKGSHQMGVTEMSRNNEA